MDPETSPLVSLCLVLSTNPPLEESEDWCSRIATLKFKEDFIDWLQKDLEKIYPIVYHFSLSYLIPGSRLFDLKKVNVFEIFGNSYVGNQKQQRLS
jgi:hypothetical protein